MTVLTTGLTLGQLRTMLRQGCGSLTVAQMDDSKCDELLNLALWDLDANFHFKEKEETWVHEFVTADRTDPITIPQELEAFQSIAIFEPNGSRHDVVREERDEYEVYTTTEPSSGGVPEKYHRWGNKLYFRPWPSANEVGWTIVASITSPIESIVNSLPRNWHRILVHKAVEIYHALNREWDLAQAAANYANTAIGYQVPIQAKEERDSRWAGIQVPDRFPTRGPFTPGTNGFNEF